MTALGVSGCGGAIDSYINGTVVGLSADATVELTNTDNGDKVSVKFNESDNSFKFDKTVAAGASYHIIVSKQPKGQTCSVEPNNGIGQVPANGGDITDIKVKCVIGNSTAVVVTVKLSGLADGATVVLSNVLSSPIDSLSITGDQETARGGTTERAFSILHFPGDMYEIKVTDQPSNGQRCEVKGNTGSGYIPTTGPMSPATVSCSFS
jgi:hypothetical protein